MIFDFIKDIFKGNGYTVTDTQTDKVVFIFNTVTESYINATSTVTNYPKEDGTLPSDYKYQNPTVISIKGIVKRNTIVGSALNAILGYGTSVKNMIEQAEYYKSGMYALTVQTKSGIFPNYTLESYEIPEDYDTYGLLEMTLNFKEIPQLNKSTENRIDSMKDTVNAGIARLLGLS